MKKKISKVAVFILVVFLFAGQLSLYAGNTLTITGKVKDVGLEDKSLVLGMGDEDQIFYMDENTQIIMDQKTKALEDISIGDVIEIQYNKSGDDNIVIKINIVPWFLAFYFAGVAQLHSFILMGGS